MESLDIFNTKKPFQKIILPPAASQRYVPQNRTLLDDTDSMKTIDTGTDYIAEYIEKEERELLESANHVHLPEERNELEEVSQGTMASIHDINKEDLTKIYRTYNFAYRPKSNLTITAVKDKIVSMIETNPVVVIQGPTGCGKTTQVPQFILNSCYKKKVHCNIIVTQPRRIAAISIAKRVSQERGWPVGTLVGYQVGMINNTSRDTRLTYCTTGVLLHKLINARNMLDYTHVILDEVHERDQDMDFLLIVVRKLLRTNSRMVKVILMSATFNVERFAKYFSSPLANKLVPAPIVDIAKRSYFNIGIFYLCQIGALGPPPEVSADEPKVTNQMMEFCIKIVIVLDELDMTADDAKCDPETGFYERHVILVFLPGIHEIEEMYSLLSSPKHKDSKWNIIVLHSSITSEEQQRIFEKPPKGHRRIILSTNIAESSITVPDVKYVIDFCLTKQLIVDPRTNFQSLELTWASKANCDQRAGRTGRVMDGRVYRLIPKKFYDSVFPEEGHPEMLRAPLENLVLKAKLLNMGEPKAILALSLDPPNLSNLERTILLLKEAGALLNTTNGMQYFDGELTDLGRVMAQLPLDIHISKLIMLGHVFSVLRDTIIIGASMAMKDMFTNSFQKKLLAYDVKLSWAGNSHSDCIAFLNVYKVWINEKANRRLSSNILEKRWAQRNFVQIKVLREVDALVFDITKRLERLGVSETVGVNKVVWNDTERPLILKVVLAGAFYPNYFVRCFQAEQVDERSTLKILGGLDPTKTVYLQGWPLKQPGLLYARSIQEVFQNSLNTPSGKIKVSFDTSSRVYIEFSRDDHPGNSNVESSKIPLVVYKAIKMRQCNMTVELPLMNEEAANQRAEQLNLLKKIPDMFFDEYESTKNKSQIPLNRPQLPALDVSHIPLIIVHILDPSHFWIHIKDGETWNNLKKVEAFLNMSEESLKKFSFRPDVGTLVAAPYKGDQCIRYLRAEIKTYVSAAEDIVTVFFIDYGYTDQIPLSELRQITEHHIINIPALALECVLTNIRPALKFDLSEKWSQASYDVFHKLISGKVQLYGEIYSVVNSIVALKLISVNKNNEKLDINSFLIEKHLALWKEEDYLSRYNHELREKNTDMSLEQRLHYEELQYDRNYVSDFYPEAPLRSECNKIVRLRGPFSPLELELSHLTQAGKGKRVNMDTNSVNSVIFDTNSKEPHDCLLVAGCVSQSASGSNLTLRNTTLMPNLPGLTALLTLIFTPCMELRRNRLGTRYIGALCGLGYDAFTKYSMFPEHDIELFFDVEITMDDLLDINKLRHWMNIGMHINSTGDDNLDEVLICQNRIKVVLFKLIGQWQLKTVKQNNELLENFGRWNRYDESLFLQPGKVPMVRNNIYNLHHALELEEKNDELEEMMIHINELRDLAVQDPRKTTNIDIECKLCNVNIFGIENLRAHLYSSKHKQNQERLTPFF